MEGYVGPNCAILLFSRSKLRPHCVPMASGRDSVRKSRSDEQRSSVVKVKDIWKRIHGPTEFVWVLRCAHILLLLFCIPSCLQSLFPIFSWPWVFPHHFNSFSFSSLLCLVFFSFIWFALAYNITPTWVPFDVSGFYLGPLVHTLGKTATYSQLPTLTHWEVTHLSSDPCLVQNEDCDRFCIYSQNIPTALV